MEKVRDGRAEMPDYQEQPNYSEEKKPLFEADNDDFVLTLFNMNYEMQANCVGQNVGQDVGQAKYLSEIIQLIRENLSLIHISEPTRPY